MADSPSLRRLVIDRVIAALESIDAKIPVIVNLEADGTLVVRAALVGLAQTTPRTPPVSQVPATAKRKPGRPRGSTKRATPAPKAATAPSPSPVGDERFSQDAVVEALRSRPPGYTMVGLVKALGGKSKSKVKLKPIIAALMKGNASADDKVEQKGGKYRLKNVERRRGRPPGTTGETPAEAKPLAQPKRRGPGRPKGARNKPKAAGAAKAEKKRGPGRPPGAKNKNTKQTKKAAKAKELRPAKRTRRKASPAQIASLKKANAARAKKAAAAKLEEKKAGKKKATKAKAKPASKKAAPAKAKPAKKTTKAKKKGSKKPMLALPEKTDEGGQIDRSETRREVADEKTAE